MPERPLSIATYAVGASLLSISLLYVFGPTFTLDGEGGVGSSKRGVVGLHNRANDCFINSVLQALAGLPDLRRYLIRETHRRRLDGPDVYKVRPEDVEGDGRAAEIKLWKLEGLRQGIVTHALKDVLDKLNERPLQRKTISAQDFIYALEQAFRTRISRQQQDAQELLQVVTERICEEYHSGQKAREAFRKRSVAPLSIEDEKAIDLNGLRISPPQTNGTVIQADPAMEKNEERNSGPVEDPFPFEGQLEAQIECQTCHFKPKPSLSSFVTLSLNVPQTSSTTLNRCFDGILKIEKIDDFKCDFCRLQHAKALKERAIERTEDSSKQNQLLDDLEQIDKALNEDPERNLPDAHLPPLSEAPTRTIDRHMRISKFPRILAVHLVRSIYSMTSLSQKNTAKVSFPELLPLGGILDSKTYKLVGVVTHKGGHNSGHYETFRRQVNIAPFSTPHSFGAQGAYSNGNTPNPSAAHTPRIAASSNSPTPDQRAQSPSASQLSSISHHSSPSSASSRSSTSISSTFRRKPPTSAPRPDSVASTTGQSNTVIDSLPSRPTGPSEADIARYKRKEKRRENRWWRISDDKVRESKTSDVLGMQKEAYLLFYELQH
jgi:ubiquitin carboxyl-terminal hydrolase 16